MTDDTPEQVQPEIKTARRKPGRKPKGETPFSFTMQIRLTQTQHEAYKLLGEYQWLRNVLDYTAEHSAGQQNAERLGSPLFLRAEPTPALACSIAEIAYGAAEFSSAGAQSLSALLGVEGGEVFSTQMPDDSLADLGVAPGDTLIVQKTDKARPDDIVAIVAEERIVIARLCRKNGRYIFTAQNKSRNLPPYPFRIREVRLLGVVTSVIRSLRSV